MNYAADLLCVRLRHEIHGILRRIPGVNDNRLLDLARQVQLPQEPLLLCLVVRLRPVIIQSDLSHRQAFLLLALFLQPGISFLRQFRGLTGMYTDGSVDVIVLLHQL